VFIITLQFDAIVKPDAVVLIHFTQRALLLWLEDVVPVTVFYEYFLSNPLSHVL
jgi:hypothetical protein